MRAFPHSLSKVARRERGPGFARLALLLCLGCVLGQLAGCAARPVVDDGSVATVPPARAPDSRVTQPAIRHAEPERAAATEERLRERLRRDARASVEGDESGYFLDVLQARLMQLRAEGVQVEREDDQFRITLAAPMFESGMNALTAEGRLRVAAVAAVLAEFRATSVVIHGHTDSSGPAEVNLALSRQRADAVARMLIEQGIARSRLLAVGHGATRPRADNGTPEGQNANRRVELVLRAVVRQDG